MANAQTTTLPPASLCSNILIPYNAVTNPTAPRTNGLYVGNYFDGSDVYVGVIYQSSVSTKANCPVEHSYPARITTNGTHNGGYTECIINDFNDTYLYYLQNDPNFIWVPTDNKTVTNVSNIIYYTNPIGYKFGYGRIFLKSANGSTYVTVGKIHLNKHAPAIYFWSQNKRESRTTNFDILVCRYEVRSTPAPTTISTAKPSATTIAIKTTTPNLPLSSFSTIKSITSTTNLASSISSSRTTTRDAVSAPVPTFKTSIYVSESRESRLAFPKELQDFRYEYLNQKGSYLKLIDRSFFDVYNTLKSRLDSISTYYLKYNATWVNSYNNFNMSNLKRGNANHLKNLFSDIDYVLSYSPKNVDSLMNNFYIALLGFESDPLIVAKSLWDIVEDHMNSISKLYSKNKSCLTNPLRKYHQIYIRGINSIIATASTTNNNISLIYSKVLTTADNSSRILKTMATDLNACNKAADPNDCIKTFIKNYDKVSEKFFEPIRQSADKIDDVKNIYENEIAKAKDNLSTVDDHLGEWTQNVAKCIDASSDSVAITDSPILGNAKVTTTAFQSSTKLTTFKTTTKSTRRG